MTNTTLAPQIQGTQKQTDPYWYRQNASYLYGVTNSPSNMQFGIEDIRINPGSPAQMQHGILANGYLKSVIGSISFMVRLSPRNGAPFVQTISTENGVDTNGEKTYWDHIVLKPQVKAQILRFFEALQTGQAPQPQQQMNYGMPQNSFGYQQQNFGTQPSYGMPQQNFGMPVPQMYQQPAQQQPIYPQYSAPMYQAPAPQNMINNQSQSPAIDPNASATGNAAPSDDLKEDDLPI
ncbi:hypothetical protein [Cytobacillus oceanisediminis]|uniref:hypothetical protein n=1 Tax=Cytobacillus oceanisediminis TaxID=665099 RepID=UPI001FB3CB2B|nr:hypothetical protein [Cytobacillus oceanisediminis]UOE58105.1 hypothetical protein IRB79_26720 [Cytobacillus oceanisediminis]